MRIAFYAPMKPPEHPVPSGDRRMARLFMAALRGAGHEVEVASRLRAWDGTGDDRRQARLEGLGLYLARRLLRRDQARRPDLWFTYHLYYKAPDWIGPAVARALDIPYVVAEASVARKRAGGPWDRGHRATLDALDQAAAVITLNPADRDGLPDRARVLLLPPFLDPAPFRAAAASRQLCRSRCAERHGLDPQKPWILALAMMRRGDKLASYRLLAQALRGLADQPWQLAIAGDGPAWAEVHQAFDWARANSRVAYLGEIDTAAVAELCAASDVLAWPAINEAYGMALLEAQAAGLPVIAGRGGGVEAVVRDGETGSLVEPGDATAFAAALRRILDAPDQRQGMARAAMAAVEAHHSLGAASRRLDEILRDAVSRS